MLSLKTQTSWHGMLSLIIQQIECFKVLWLIPKRRMQTRARGWWLAVISYSRMDTSLNRTILFLLSVFSANTWQEDPPSLKNNVRNDSLGRCSKESLVWLDDDISMVDSVPCDRKTSLILAQRDETQRRTSCNDLSRSDPRESVMEAW
jgi:hypothetical protein